MWQNPQALSLVSRENLAHWRLFAMSRGVVLKSRERERVWKWIGRDEQDINSNLRFNARDGTRGINSNLCFNVRDRTRLDSFTCGNRTATVKKT